MFFLRNSLHAFTSVHIFGINMKAVVLLCLLHAAFIETQNPFSWPEPDDAGITDVNEKYGCESNQAMCGCCLMQRQMKRFEITFYYVMEAMQKELSFSQMTLNHTRDKRSIFSVALSNNLHLDCIGPFAIEENISFNHVFINIQNSYNVDTGVFTVPSSGVYSLSVTLYSYSFPASTSPTCADLRVNGQVMASLPKTNGHDDKEDSSTRIIAIKLEAGDQVAVTLPADCVVCDDDRHMSVFTGFLLYATD